jgi:hypothetical protein
MLYISRIWYRIIVQLHDFVSSSNPTLHTKVVALRSFPNKWACHEIALAIAFSWYATVPKPFLEN